MSSTAILEIDFQPWILQTAHDPAVVGRAVAARERLADRAALFALRYRSLDPADPLRFDLDGPGARFLPELAPAPGAVVLSKTGRDPFDNPDLLSNLRCREITSVVIYGLLTEGGVLEAARTAHRLGFEANVIADACAGRSLQSHQAALAQIASFATVS